MANINKQKLINRAVFGSETNIDEIIRVNHAGEYGAKVIYKGQLDAAKSGSFYNEIKEMYDQELEHLEYFEQEIVKRKVRPTALQPFWHIAGYMLGFITAKMGREQAMVATEAIEEVIEAHYAKQIESLGSDEAELKAKIIQFREEEIEHKNIASEAVKHSVFNSMLSKVIGFGCKVAIAVAKKI